ncbi:MAG: hypothetical protein JXR83_02155, partial [Deltaproteobacteria bacterium]|nr:hypothetical protein [Deltaproteobacteria bacterium]
KPSSAIIVLLTAVDPAWRGAGGRLFSPHSDDKKTYADQRAPARNWLKKTEQRHHCAAHRS